MFSLQTAFTDEFEFLIKRTAHGQKRLIPKYLKLPEEN
jgi:hypothetical protein